MKRNSHFEVTTKIRCNVGCLRYCPQEIFTKNYTGDRILSVENFKRMISDVPASTTIIFSGLSEPFLNKDTPRMIIAAHEDGHPVVIFSTLTGLSPEDAVTIKNIPFERFTLHLPDSYGVAHIPDTEEYSKSLNIILRNVQRINYMNMGYGFVSDKSEERIRKITTIPKMHFTPYCDHHEYQDIFVLPNGDAYFCCQTRGQSNLVGNIYQESYQNLLEKHSAMSTEMRNDPESICFRCMMASPSFMYPLKKIFGTSLINIGKRYFL